MNEAENKFVAFLKEEIDRHEKQIIALEATLETMAKTKYAKSIVNQQIDRAHTQKVQTQIILDKYQEWMNESAQPTDSKIVLELDKEDAKYLKSLFDDCDEFRFNNVDRSIHSKLKQALEARS